jgi:hypothetical protein
MEPRKRLTSWQRRQKAQHAAAVNPHDRPTGAKSWPKWSLKEAKRQGQAEMFPGRHSEDPDVIITKQRRRKRRMGVFG